jgi:hypothetical protein
MNKIISSTDTNGNATVIRNSDRSILIVGEGVDATKELVFNISSTADASTHFGGSSSCIAIVNILIKNGVKNIKGIVTGEYAATGKPYTTKALAYAGAFAKSLVVDDIMCIILDTTDPTINAGLKAHLDSADAEELFRYGVVGVPTATTTVAGAVAIATAITSDRMFLAYPNVVNDSGVVQDGCCTSAGIAAIIVTQTNDPALPVSGISINGFGGVASKLLTAELSTLVTGGVTPLYPNSGLPTIYRLVTTAQKVATVDSIWHDATTRFIADDVLMAVEEKLRANYKRTKNVSRIINSIKTDVIGVLENKAGLEIIQNFDKSTVSVIKDPNDTYGALVDYQFQVVTPLYTITITQHMKI